MADEVSSQHTHEPAIQPVFDCDGRCLVCSAQVEADEMRAWATGAKSWTNMIGPGLTPDVVATMDAQEVVKHAAAIQGYAALIEVYRNPLVEL